jgi:hypothetical protein
MDPIMMNKKAAASLLLLSIFALPALAQHDFSVSQWNTDRIQFQQRSMMMLGGWALTNIAIGVYGWQSSDGALSYFHQMNAGWNVVNLGIAGLAMYGLKGADPSSFSLMESLKEGQNLEQILLLNAGLDVGYIALGGYLLERGKRKASARLKGYGSSLILQGAFLLTFDSVLVYLTKQLNAPLLQHLEQVTVSATGVSVRIPL